MLEDRRQEISKLQPGYGGTTEYRTVLLLLIRMQRQLEGGGFNPDLFISQVDERLSKSIEI